MDENFIRISIKCFKCGETLEGYSEYSDNQIFSHNMNKMQSIMLGHIESDCEEKPRE